MLAWVNCGKVGAKEPLEVDAVLLLLNLTFFVLPIFSTQTKCELNGSNYTLMEADIVRNYGVDSRTSCS